MKWWFVLGAAGLALFEAAKVYFIMPFPGSQPLGAVDIAYQLHSWRWPVRIILLLLILFGSWPVWRAGQSSRIWGAAALLLVGALGWFANFRMAADQMFRQPEELLMVSAAENAVALDRLVIGVSRQGEARAYPIQFIGYHHQVRDRLAGAPILVSYCTVCRTGRVFEPLIDGQLEEFRLVGMDRWNAMFEDSGSGSWWRQANGEAISGPRKGQLLPELPGMQLSLARWLEIHPDSLIMQADPASVDRYPTDYDFEDGSSRGALTGTNPDSWAEKSWVLGITLDGHSKAYDWNHLRDVRVINDEIGGKPVLLVLADDLASFYAYLRPDGNAIFELLGDELVSGTQRYTLAGKNMEGDLQRISASQEFWHSWRTFQPDTRRYPADP